TLTTPTYYDGSTLLYATHAYVARYDPSGSLLWVHDIGASTSDGYGQGAQVAVDGSGNIYAGGNFSETVNFGTDASGNPVPRKGPTAASGDVAEYVVKYAPDGTVQWAVTVCSVCNTNERLTVDPQGDVLVANYFGGTKVVGGQTLSYTNGHY